MMKQESVAIVVHGGEIHGPFENTEKACEFADGMCQSNGKRAYIIPSVTICERELPAIALPEIHPSTKSGIVNDLTAAVLEQLKALLPQLVAAGGQVAPTTPPTATPQAPTPTT